MKYSLGLNGELPPLSVLEKFNSIGMIRGEYLCRSSGEWILRKKCQDMIQEYIEKISEFSDIPIWYRLIDMESNEVNTLLGCDHIITEKTTMMGLRGVRRGLTYNEALIVELKLLCKVAMNKPNVNLLIPFVCDASEVSFVIKYLRENSFKGKIGVMLETPAAILGLESILRVGVDHLVVGMNDLTSLTLGVNRNSPLFRFHHESIIHLISLALKKANENNTSISIAGYFELSDIEMCTSLGFEEIIIHYSLLPNIWPNIYDNLPDIIDFYKIKKLIRAKVNDPGI